MSYDLRVERVLNAGAEEVFDAYTDAEAAMVWFRLGPDGPDDSIVEISNDLRVGGEWRAAWGDSRERLFRERGVWQVTEEVRDFFATVAWAGAFERIERYLALPAAG
jgi:uncharacterized protein YndB with AHSA1/START domain